jgi:N-acylglucosamine-6-phosphate 2-epimerase
MAQPALWLDGGNKAVTHAKTPTDGSVRNLGTLIDKLGGRLVVSCQAPPGHPLAELHTIVALCRCAERGGAAGVRVDSVEAVRAAKQAVGIPVLGLKKAWQGHRGLTGGRPAITPEVQDAVDLAGAGADIVAVEATRELRGNRFAKHLGLLRSAIDIPVLADVSTVGEGVAAYAAGADLVGTTLSGYTVQSERQPGPDLALVRELAGRGIPTVAEGRISTPEQASAAIGAGAIFVVVGKAITDPLARTATFVAAIADWLAEANR